MIFKNPLSAGSANNNSLNGLGSGGSTAPPVVQGTVNVAAIYPTHGANWMDYVQNSGGGGQAWNRPDTACNPDGGVSYFKCLHGGELRTFQATGISSCAGLSAQDALGAFNWACDASTSPVTFRSRGLKYGKGLRDLVDGSVPAFKPNSVTVYNPSLQPIFRTPSSVWWGNAFAFVPTGGNPQALSANTIYVAPSSASFNGYYISQVSHVGLVTLGTLTYGGITTDWCNTDGHSTPAGGAGNYAMLCMGGTAANEAAFNWIEVSFNGNAARAASAIDWGDYARMNRFHRSFVTEYGGGNGFNTTSGSAGSDLIDQSGAEGGGYQPADSGFWFSSQVFDTVINSVGANSGGQFGFRSNGASPLVLYQDSFYNNQQNNVDVFGWGNGKEYVVGLTTFGSQGPGIDLENDSKHTYLAVTSANNGGANAGICNPENGGNANIVLQTNCGGAANQISMSNVVVSGSSTSAAITVASGTHTFTDIFAAYSGTGINIANNVGVAPTFNGRIWVGQNTTNCADPGSKSNITSASCARGGTAASSTTADPASSFAGIVSSDSVNASTGLTFPMPYGSNGALLDWFGFANPFRGWGADGAPTLFGGANAASCLSGNCQLFDWTVKAGDSLLRGQYGTWTNNGSCPSSTDPSNAANVVSDYNGNKFLLAAIEVMDPWLNPNGNYDGLCEDGEVCIFTPNLGSYQGSGDPSATTPCATPVSAGNGFPTGVTLYAYPNP